MSLRWDSLRVVGILASTTVGAGIFALPYVFLKAGWGTGVIYLAMFGAVMVVAHYLYWKILDDSGGKKRLLFVVKDHFGLPGFYSSVVAVMGGLVLTLVAYLILATKFFKIIFPYIDSATALAIFWIISSIPLILSLKRFAGMEFLGSAVMVGIIFMVFFSALPGGHIAEIDLFIPDAWFLPFGAVLFSLAGWTAIEPIYELKTKLKKAGRLPEFVLGTALVVGVYLIFVVAVFGITSTVTPDTVSGLNQLGYWPGVLLSIFGLLALWTSYLPISREVKNLLTDDLRWGSSVAVAVVFLAPMVFVAVGVRNFFDTIGLVGGVFLALQYVVIVLVAKKIFSLEGWANLGVILLSSIFVVGALYEIYYFVVE